mmetsp:Transcript_22051/g.63265  ORF Transcript_22051/g.63265 Transcript_22051/m.63265 type:complete len:206 (-) Transcript_22051:452-1069(-)
MWRSPSISRAGSHMRRSGKLRTQDIHTRCPGTLRKPWSRTALRSRCSWRRAGLSGTCSPWTWRPSPCLSNAPSRHRHKSRPRTRWARAAPRSSPRPAKSRPRWPERTSNNRTGPSCSRCSGNRPSPGAAGRRGNRSSRWPPCRTVARTRRRGRPCNCRGCPARCTQGRCRPWRRGSGLRSSPESGPRRPVATAPPSQVPRPTARA